MDQEDCRSTGAAAALTAVNSAQAAAPATSAIDPAAIVPRLAGAYPKCTSLAQERGYARN